MLDDALTQPDVPTFFKDMADPVPKKRRAMKTRPKVKPSELARNSERLLETVQGCQACDLIAAFVDGWTCGMWPVDVHHRRRQGPGRTKGGGHMLPNLRVVCRKAHTGWIHDIRNLELARALGLLVMPDDDEFAALALTERR